MDKKEEGLIIDPNATPKPKRILSGMKNKQDRETVGKIITDLKAQYDEKDFADVSEIGKELTKDLWSTIWEHVLQKKEELQCVFFVMLTKQRDPITGLGKTFLTTHIACPTPHFFQSMWRFNPKRDELQYLWSLPGPQRCVDMYNERAYVPMEEWQMMGYAIKFLDGDLDKLVVHLNHPSRPEPEDILNKKE